MCIYQTKKLDGKNRERITCSLKYYGGVPDAAACDRCIAANQNTPEEAGKLFKAAGLTHPPDIMPVSGCCDSALDSPGG